MLYGFLLNKKAECESQIFFSRLEFIVETRCSSGVKTVGEHLQCISHNTGLISWVYQCWIGTLVSYGYEGCADCCLCQPTAREGGAISHARHEISRTFFPLPYQSTIIFLHALLKCPLQGAGQDAAAALAKKPAWSRLINLWFHFYFTLTFRLHRRGKKTQLSTRPSAISAEFCLVLHAWLRSLITSFTQIYHSLGQGKVITSAILHLSLCWMFSPSTPNNGDSCVRA